MSSRGRSTIAKMLSSALKDVQRELVGATTTTNACKTSGEAPPSMEPYNATSSASKGRTTRATKKSRRLSEEEVPEVLRPHCSKCGCGEALRPGLDCRCHCPDCIIGSPRCSSPRMANRKEKGDSCETFVRESQKAKCRGKSIQAHNRTPPSPRDEAGEVHHPQKRARSEATQEVQASSRKQPGGSIGTKEKKPSNACHRGETGQCGKFEEAKSGDPSQCKAKHSEDSKPKIIVTKAPCDSTGMQTTSSASQSQRSGATQSTSLPSKEVQHEKQSQEIGKALVAKVPPQSLCKRVKCAKAALTASKGVGEHVGLHNWELWSEAGRLRELDLICYCDPCMGLKSSICSSPRMAELQNSKTGYESSRHRFTKKVK